MRLYFVRHGTAEEKLGKNDPERALTKEGREEIELVAPYLEAAVEEPMKLISSPYLRAEQTAEILREALGNREKIAPTNALLPDADWASLRKVLEDFDGAGAKSVVAVGHNPSISEMVARIVAGEDDARISMAKGAVACLEIDHLHGRPAGELKWLLTPKALRAKRRDKG
jgi:phosphohistidine phosphatase